MLTNEIAQFKRLGVRGILLQALNIATMIAGGIMSWKALCLVTNSASPVVVVLSGSMEPAFYRGDILFLTNPVSEQYVVGDITVYQVPGTDIPIVHRVIETRTSSNASQLLLTKGDNNHADDLALYAKGMQWVEREHVVGKVRGFLPYIGYLTIALNDFPQLKYALLGVVFLLMLVQRE